MQIIRVQAAPEFESVDSLRDFLARAAWHFEHVPEIQLFIALAKDMDRPASLEIPEGFASEVQRVLNTYLPRVIFQLNHNPANTADLIRRADIVLKWVEDDILPNDLIIGTKKTTYRVDPKKVRQEGSFFIQCAFDVLASKAQAVADSTRKFKSLVDKIGRRERTWVMATGPSVEKYRDHDFKDAAVIVCNSVVLNDDLMERCKPIALVFADPIFHFGVSQYAGRFREVVAHRMATMDLAIVVPMKYYPLLLSKFPDHAENIIGVPFFKTKEFNNDIYSNFEVKTTSNILTLLLLPLATSISKIVNIIGCDGRPLEHDDYFWSHGESVQINDKMSNIKVVHPGFFDIDYNEYYFEHCHTLANLLAQAESEGWRFVHHGPSYIPALRDRSAAALDLPIEQARSAPPNRIARSSQGCIVLEPDGIGLDGHYVRWHRNIIAQLNNRFERVDVLCNRKQDAKLYPCPARPTFSSFSWGISRSDFSRRRDFAEHASFKRFVEEMSQGIREQYPTLPTQLSLYIYYGSVQILKAVQIVRRELLREGTDLRAFVCLFHESVILDPAMYEPRFPPNAAEILFESAAQVDSYHISCVTERLSNFVRNRFDVTTSIFPNPPPDLGDVEAISTLEAALATPKPSWDGDSFDILFPTNPRNGKGDVILSALLDYVHQRGVPVGQRYLMRGTPPQGHKDLEGLIYLGEGIGDQEYRDHFKSADVVVIPYPAPGFSYRTSGIMVDALISATPCIVLDDTWLADTVRRTGAGLPIKYRSPLTIITAINAVLAHRAAIRQRMSGGAYAYLSENSWAAAAALAMA
jgi:glycosyltransferase involved in cell wall biosynthesis